MNKKMRLTFLGTATSSGVPVVGCDCPVCVSDDPRDFRFRTSAYLVTSDNIKILIDPGPDFRFQSLKHNINWLDGILITHSHQDHIGGIDELRQINHAMGKELELYGNGLTLSEIRNRFSYIFKKTQKGGGKPRIDLHKIKAGKPFAVEGCEVVPLNVIHGKIPILGYKIGRLTYITDASEIPNETIELIADTDTLVINALRYRPHSTHFNLEQALEIIEKIRPKAAYLVHCTHDFKQSELDKTLPEGVFLAYDNLQIEINK